MFIVHHLQVFLFHVSYFAAANTAEHFLQFKLEILVHKTINEWVYEVIAYVEGTKKQYKADQVWVSSRNFYTK